MKIAIVSSGVIPCPPPGYAGLEQLTWQQAEGLAKLGHDVTLFAPDGSRCDHAKVFHFGPPGQWNERSLYEKYWQQLLDFDCVIDSSWNKWSYILKAEGRLKAPVLGVVHSLVNNSFQSLPPVDKPCFVCISHDQASHFEAYFNCPTRVAYNGVCSKYYSPMSGVRRSGRFLFLARFSSIKGADIAIRACKIAGVRLDLVGDDKITGEPDYLRQCQDMCDGDNIRIVGPATRGECVRWFSQAHVLIHPNQRFREPFGLAPVEAMLCKTPVIAWRNGAVKETIDNGKSGHLVGSFDELVDVIKRYAESNVVTIDMRDYCREWASKFSVEAMISRYESLCVEAIKTGGW